MIESIGYFVLAISRNFPPEYNFFQTFLVKEIEKQAGAELGQAQLQLELGFTLIKVCCISY